MSNNTSRKAPNSQLRYPEDEFSCLAILTSKEGCNNGVFVVCAHVACRFLVEAGSFRVWLERCEIAVLRRPGRAACLLGDRISIARSPGGSFVVVAASRVKKIAVAQTDGIQSTSQDCDRFCNGCPCCRGQINMCHAHFTQLGAEEPPQWSSLLVYSTNPH